MQFGGQHDLAVDDNTDVQFWCVADTAIGNGDFGTPGAANSNCPVPAIHTIYEIQDENDGNHPAEGTLVNIIDVVVTFTDNNNLWIQETGGGEYSGMYVSAGAVDVSALVRGDRGDFVGQYVESTNGGARLNLQAVTPNAMTMVVDPLVVDSAVLAADAEPYEGVLVQVNEAGVTNFNADGAAGDFGEFRIDAAIRVDDFLYDYDAVANPANCDFFQFIAGPVNFSFNNHKIVPRDAADMGAVNAAPQQTTVDVQLGVGSGYDPREICVNETDTVTWTNLDAAIGHTVHERDATAVAPNNIGAALVATLAGGGTGTFTFNTAGTEHYRCMPHANMEGVVIVLEP
jgi:plastocyanin